MLAPDEFDSLKLIADAAASEMRRRSYKNFFLTGIRKEPYYSHWFVNFRTTEGETTIVLKLGSFKFVGILEE